MKLQEVLPVVMWDPIFGDSAGSNWTEKDQDLLLPGPF